MYFNKKYRWICFAFFYLWLIPLSHSNEKLDNNLYLNQADFSPELLLPPPQEYKSEETKAEIAFLKNKMSKLNQDQKNLAVKDALNLSVTFFSDTIPGFHVDQLPKTKLLFEIVKYNASFESQLFKKHFMRRRPYQEDSTIKVCVPPTADNLNHSYPSGHTTLGFASGIVLAHLIPEKSEEILDRASLYGENRINCGAHFPSDVVAGQVLGSLVGMELIKNEEFKRLFKASKEELVNASLTH